MRSVQYRRYPVADALETNGTLTATLFERGVICEGSEFARDRQAWLSLKMAERIAECGSCLRPRDIDTSSSTMRRGRMTLMPFESEIYSASIVERAVSDWRTPPQETGIFPRVITNPDRDFTDLRSSWSAVENIPAKSASDSVTVEG